MHTGTIPTQQRISGITSMAVLRSVRRFALRFPWRHRRIQEIVTRSRVAALVMGLIILFPATICGESWPQFRGPEGTAVQDGSTLPARIGPDESVVWRVSLPPGHSSPVIHGGRIFVTAVDGDRKLLTIALDCRTGKELWRAEDPRQTLESLDPICSHAQATPVTDGRYVISLFGSTGLSCFSIDGQRVWHVPLPKPLSPWGIASSPVIVQEKVIVNRDCESRSSLMVFDLLTGKVLKEVDRSEFRVGYASPVLWKVGTKTQIVQAGTGRVIGYDAGTFEELWTVRGMARMINTTPTVAPNGTLFVSGWSLGSDPGEQFAMPPFADLVQKHDANKNGTLEFGEVPGELVLKPRFSLFDENRDDHVTRAEYERTSELFTKSVNRMVAIRPGDRCEIAQTNVVWEQTKKLPYNSSPLVYRNVVFLVRDGGLLRTLDANSGKELKYGRLPGSGNYYASPVAGDGKVYLCSQLGDVTIVSGEANWTELHFSKFGEEVFATPAIADGKIFLRTKQHLYCLGGP